jgi:ribonuclease D
MPESIVTDAAALRALCLRLAPAPWIALDTEFMRVNTYRARLCLIQLATPDEIACVDPLALGDIGPLLDLLYRPTIVKVLHAARQDLEVLADLCRTGTYQCRGRQDVESDNGAPPRPLFDTQIAAALTGDDDQIGYAGLVEKIAGHKLDKIEARTDWAARPLSAAQLRYAADDVRYLRDVYTALAARLHDLGRSDWLHEECAALTDPALYRNDPELAWRRLGAGAMLAPAQQTVLVALAAWREREAERRDLPRGWVVPDVALVELARRAPQTLAVLAEIAELKPAMIRRDGETLLQRIAEARALPVQRYWDPPERLDATQMALIKRLSALVQDKARETGISATLVAPRRELTRLVRGERELALLRGWRREFVGAQLLAELEKR